VLLVRAGLSGSDGTPVATLPTTTGATAATTTEPVTSPTRTSTETTGGVRFYRIESGDTLESIAADHGTSVEVLLELNPDVDPVALTVGQRIRVS
jgi:LysM repeat protein